MVKIYYFYGEPDYYIYRWFLLHLWWVLHLWLIITFMDDHRSWRFPVVPTVHICHGWFLQVNNLLVVVQPIRVADASGCRNEQKEVLKAVVPFILFPISLLFYPSLPSHFNACSSWRSTKKFKTKLKVLDDRWTEVFFLVLERKLGAYSF